MSFGQLVIGPPGSGKTTYCHGMQQFLTGVGRKVSVINLDPANDILPYSCTVNISDLITVSDAMDNLNLGPNGGLIYCIEYLEKNIDWLLSKLEKLKDHYFLFDCPGQIELYTHHESIRNIMRHFDKLNYRFVSVHLVDSYYCCHPAQFISVVLSTLSTMLQIELPHISILSKIDLVEQHGRLPLNLDFYTEVMDLSYLLNWLQKDVFLMKFKKLNAAFCGIIEDYGLVSFHTLDIQDKESMLRVMKAADKANGYIFGDLEEHSLKNLMSSAIGAEFEWSKIGDISTKYMEPDESEVL